MNGRVYDYNLGRFLSVDPFIQDPGNSQSMNPYSYIMNNPLAGTDPSGYEACKAEANCTTQTVEKGDKIVKDKEGNQYLDKGGDTLVKIESATVSNNGAKAAFDVNKGKGSNLKIENIGSSSEISGSDTGSLVGGVVGVGAYADTHPFWVGENGQIKANSSNYHGNDANGSKITQIAKMKEFFKRLGLPIAVASTLYRSTETKEKLKNMRAKGVSQKEINYEKIDLGVDIAMIGVGVTGPTGLAVALGYTGMDMMIGGNLSKFIAEEAGNAIRNIPNIPSTNNEIQSFTSQLFGFPDLSNLDY